MPNVYRRLVFAWAMGPNFLLAFQLTMCAKTEKAEETKLKIVFVEVQSKVKRCLTILSTIALKQGRVFL